jgi:Tfp pilus tip-associated adhesin PilY1
MPPSIKTVDYANIMFLLDISKSMLNKAYTNINTRKIAPFLQNIIDFINKTNHPGYFKPNRLYCYDFIFNGSSLKARNAISANLSDISSNFDNIIGNKPVLPIYYYDCTDWLNEFLTNSGINININISELFNILIGLIPQLIEIIPSLISLDLTVLLTIIQPLLQAIGTINANIQIEKLLDLLFSAFGNTLNYSLTTKADIVNMILTGGKVDTIGRCVQISNCLKYSTILGLNPQECPSDSCRSITLGSSGNIIGNILQTLIDTLASSIPALSTVLGLFQNINLCLPNNNLDCYSKTKDECSNNDGTTMCEWQTRDVILAKDGSYGIEWKSASTYQRERKCIFDEAIGNNDNGIFRRLFNRNQALGGQSRGCLVGLLDIMADSNTWKDETPNISATIYADKLNEDNISTLETRDNYKIVHDFINSNYNVAGLLAHVNSAGDPVEFIDGLDNTTVTSEAVSKTADILFTENNIKVPCQKNYFFYMSDGLFDPEENDPVKNIYNLWHGNTEASDKFENIPGIQNIETYAFNMDLADNKTTDCENSMKHAAIFGGYREYDGEDGPCNYNGRFPTPDSKSDIAESCIEWDSDLDGKPDNYFPDYNRVELYESLIKSIFDKAVEGALEQHYNSTAPAIARFNDTQMGLWINAFYFPKLIYNGLSANWRGDVRGYFLDTNNSIRENNDVNGDEDEKYKLFNINISNNKKYYEDDLITFTTGIIKNGLALDESESSNEYGTQIDEMISTVILNYGRTYYDNLTPEECSPEYRTILKYENNGSIPVWSTLFDGITASEIRNIYYNDNQNNNSSYRNLNALPLFDNNTNFVNLLKDIWCINDEKNINEIINQLKTGKNGFLYGDIINSSPIIVPPTPINNYHNKYGDLTYYDYTNSKEVRERLPIVIMGGNDGMVHAFYTGLPSDNLETSDADNTLGLLISESGEQNKNYNSDSYSAGQEIWAFIPYNALPYMQWYAMEGTSYHIPKVDYNFTLVDASIGEDGKADAGSDLSVDSWRTILIGTMGFGGKKIEFNGKTFSSSIFALDITNTNISGKLVNGDTAKSENPKFIWETTLPDNTLVLGKPAVIKIKDSGDKNTNGDWYVVVGSGPNNPQADNFTNATSIYFIDLKTGKIEEKNKILLRTRNMAIGEIMEVDSDNNYSNDTLFFGTYNDKTGALYSVDVENGVDINNLAIQQILGRKFNAPYFSKPENTFDEYGNLWIYAGSGRLFTDNDMLSNDDLTDENIANQYILGVRFKRDDNGLINVPNRRINNLEDMTDAEVTATVDNASCYCAGVYLGPVDNNFSCNDYDCCKGNDESDEKGFVKGCNVIVDTVDNPELKNINNIPNNNENTVDAYATNLANKNNYNGWYIDLKSLASNSNVGYSQNANLENNIKEDRLSYERTYSAPSVYGGLVNFVTYTPIFSPCTVTGTTRLHTLNYITGTPAGQISITSKDNILESSNNIKAGDSVTLSGNTVIGKEGMSLPPPTGKSMTSVKDKDGKVTTFVGSTRIVQQTPNGSNIGSRILFKKIR